MRAHDRFIFLSTQISKSKIQDSKTKIPFRENINKDGINAVLRLIVVHYAATRLFNELLI